jgi:hypothetical protein
VNARVVREFGVEGRGHDFSLADSDRIITLGGDDFHVLPNALDFWRADEDHFGRAPSEDALADGAIDLASVGVAADGDVERAQAVLLGIVDFVGQENRTGASTERRLPAHELFQFFESGFAQQLEEGTGLAAGDDEAVDFVELLGFLDKHNFGAQLLEPLAVSVKVALQGKNTDFHKNQRPQRAERMHSANTSVISVVRNFSPTPGLQHLRLIQRGDGQAFHRASQVFADFK